MILYSLFLLCGTQCFAKLLFPSDEFRAKAAMLIQGCKYSLLIIVEKIDSPDEFVTNAILNIQSVALNGPMDPDALAIWLDRLDQSINLADNAAKYSTLRSEANTLKSLDPITGGPVVGNPGIVGGVSAQGSPTAIINSATQTVLSTNLVTTSQTLSQTGSQILSQTGSQILSQTASATSTRIASDRPRGLPFQPQTAGSSTLLDFGLCSIILILFF